MTIKLSPHKVSKVMRYYFRGYTQVEIGKRARVDQSTVSIYATRFKGAVDQVGLLGAGREFSVINEVEALRSLAVELLRNKLTAEEAREGVTILKLFNSLGVSPSEHKALIKVISKLKDPEFVPAAIKLAELKATTGKTHTEIVSEFEHLGAETSQLREKIAALKGEKDALTESIKELTATRKKEQEGLSEFQRYAEQKRCEAEACVAKKMKEANLTLQRIEKLEPLANALNKLGVSDGDIEVYVSEHKTLDELGIGWGNFMDIVRGIQGDN